MHIIDKMKVNEEWHAISDMSLAPHSIIIVIREGKGYDPQYVKWAKIQDNRSDMVNSIMTTDSHYEARKSVHIWEIRPSFLTQIKMFWEFPLPEEKEQNPVLKDLKEVQELKGEIVFDWACCDGCGDGSFGLENEFTMKFIRQAMSRGLVCVFSDFSAKALLTQWDPALLSGECPLELSSECVEGYLTLEFDPQTLRECPFQQLRRLGELSDLTKSANVEVFAMDSTVVLKLKPQFRISPTPRPQMETLPSKTPATGFVTPATGFVNSEYFTTQVLSHTKKTTFKPSSKIGWSFTMEQSEVSSLCHVILTYPEKHGQIFISQIHLAETQKLMNSHVAPEKLTGLVEQSLGTSYAETFSSTCSMAQSQIEVDEIVEQAEKDIILSSLCLRSPTL